MRPTPSDRTLAVFLKLTGAVMLLAFPAALLPADWMDGIHRWLGLGDLPRAPIVDYLARSASLLYGYQGTILLYLSGDPRRHAPLLLFLGLVSAALSVAFVLIDIGAGMPLYWTLGEGPLLLVFSAVIILLARPLAMAGERTRIVEG
jgi:hypothetical protein